MLRLLCPVKAEDLCSGAHPSLIQVPWPCAAQRFQAMRPAAKTPAVCIGPGCELRRRTQQLPSQQITLDARGPGGNSKTTITTNNHYKPSKFLKSVDQLMAESTKTSANSHTYPKNHWMYPHYSSPLLTIPPQHTMAFLNMPRSRSLGDREPL